MADSADRADGAESEFARFLRRAMELLGEECPAVFRELCAKLAGARIRLSVDGGAVSPEFSEGGFALVAPYANPDVELESHRAAILAVIDGAVSFEDAVWEERLFLRGSLEALATFHDGFVLCVHGAVRCPSFPVLLQQYRRAGDRPSGDPS